jgi:uncharacterized coiled-coil DUF342 family protein
LIKAVNEDGKRFRKLQAEYDAKAKARAEWRLEANQELRDLAAQVDKQLASRPWYVKLFRKFF